MDSLKDLRFLGIDYGRRRTGIAISDPTGTLASPLTTLSFRGLEDLAARIAELAREYNASGIVLGFPRHLDGAPGDLGPEVERLAGMLRDRGSSVVLWDERLTSWEASRRLGASRRRRPSKESIDAAAAALILQSYLDESGGG